VSPVTLIEATRASAETLSALDKRLLDDFQRDFPLCPAPFAELGRRLGVTEAVVLERLEDLVRRGYISRIGPVFRPNRVGASTLAAMAVPPDRLAEVARLVNTYPEINHNYEREHELNLWFVVTAPRAERVAEVLAEIGTRSGLDVLDLPLEEAYHIDLGFSLWNDSSSL